MNINPCIISLMLIALIAILLFLNQPKWVSSYESEYDTGSPSPSGAKQLSILTKKGAAKLFIQLPGEKTAIPLTGVLQTPESNVSQMTGLSPLLLLPSHKSSQHMPLLAMWTPPQPPGPAPGSDPFFDAFHFRPQSQPVGVLTDIKL